MTFAKGDEVTITCEGRTVDGVILIASSNGRSLALGFEALLAGHAGMMPVLQHDDGIYRSLVGGIVIGITKRRKES